MYNDTLKIAERIKYLREVFALSQEELALAVNIPLELYKEAENGKFDFTFSFLQKLAKYYSVDIVELISGDTPKLSEFQIVRSGEGMPLERRKGFKYLHLASLFKDKAAEPFIVTARYDENEHKQPITLSTHNDQEFNMVIEGSLKFQISDHITVLNKGDSVYYNAAIPHGMIAEQGDCKFLSLVIKSGKETAPLTVTGGIQTYKEQNALYRKFITPKLDKDGRLLSLDFHPEDNFNFAYDVVDAIQKKSPNKTAMLWVSAEKEEKIFTFTDMKVLSDKCANFFTSLGIKKGDRVMLVLKRYHQFWTAVLALHKIGAVAVPATHLLSKSDFEYRFNAAGISAVVITSDGHAADECDLAIATTNTVRTKIICGTPREGWLDFDSGTANASPDFARVENHIDDVMLMYFTSGTTRYPKIATHTHRYPLGHFVTAKYWHNVDPDGLHLTISDTGWAKSVWGKLYGQWIAEAPIFTYNFEKFSASDILKMFEQYGITTFCAPPTMYRYFIKEDLSKFNLSSLKHATIAGEALNPEVFSQFYKATGLKLMEGFGQTEATLMIANLVGTEPKPGSMGKPCPQYDIDLIDENGNSVKTGEAGEIVIRTKNGAPYGLFQGYFGDEAETKKAWNNQVYHTGDLAWQDEDGYIWYESRVDDMIKSSGYRIGPFEVESVIMEIPYVLECAVTGVPDETRGQAIKATIVLVDGKAPTEELKKEIQTYVKEHTAPYKYPRIIEFVEGLPKTISGKIKRKDLR